MRLILARGERIDQRKLIRHLTELQYTRGARWNPRRGSYRVRGEVIDVFFPAESENRGAAHRVVRRRDRKPLAVRDPLTGALLQARFRASSPWKTHYDTTRDRVLHAIDTIKEELKERLDHLYKAYVGRVRSGWSSARASTSR